MSTHNWWFKLLYHLLQRTALLPWSAFARWKNSMPTTLQCHLNVTLANASKTERHFFIFFQLKKLQNHKLIDQSMASAHTESRNHQETVCCHCAVFLQQDFGVRAHWGQQRRGAGGRCTYPEVQLQVLCLKKMLETEWNRSINVYKVSEPMSLYSFYLQLNQLVFHEVKPVLTKAWRWDFHRRGQARFHLRLQQTFCG